MMEEELYSELYSDNAYGYALYKTLTKVEPPLTVGLYSSCHNRINMILTSIEGQMNEESKRKKQNSSIRNLLSLLFHLIFYRPVWTLRHKKTNCTRYVFVRFSAWHFAGSDMLWAGLVMQLVQTIQEKFGKLQLSLFRAAQYDPEEDAKAKKIEICSKDWRPKKLCCFPLWVFFLMLLLVTVFILVPVIAVVFSGQKYDEEGEIGAKEGFAIAMFGIPVAGVLFKIKPIFVLMKSLIVTEGANIRRALDNEKISEQLGLMYEVRKEMRLLSCFIHFLEVFEKQKIRVVLEITNLDRCTQEKIVSVLDAINILLSDEESPFISLVAIDPEVIAQKIDQANGCSNDKDSAYEFLNHTIMLPFTIPPLCDVSKRKIFKNIAFKTPADNQGDEWENRMNEHEVEKLIQGVFHVILNHQSVLLKYITENAVSMRRVIYSIRLYMLVMNALARPLILLERVAAWIVLVESWPCRLSWILQCAEDTQQTLISNGRGVDDYKMKTLWDVYTEHRMELHFIRNKVEHFLERDGDPELFERFLKTDYDFTVREVDELYKYTVNMHYFIKNEMARIRQSNTVRGTERTTFNKLSPSTVIHMTVEDVCNELSRLRLPDKYTEIVKENHINGQTLLFSNPADLKEVMHMTLGEWTALRVHFLGAISNNHLTATQSVPEISNPKMNCPSNIC